MTKMKDLVKRKFGRLTVLGLDERRTKYRQARWICRCDCGETTVVIGSKLTSGHTLSCGCLQREKVSKANKTHGKGQSRAYRAWARMKQRCQNRNENSYMHYGGRGIKVCNRWQRFENFYADMGDPPPGMSLDRVNVNGDYEPSNCRWATDKEQANNKRNNLLVEYDGQVFTLKQLADQLDMNYKTLFTRLRNGWSIEEAVNTPVRKS